MFLRRHPLLAYLIPVATVALAAIGLSALCPRPDPAKADSLGQLQGQLGAQQVRQQSLSSSIASLDRTIGSLDGQISLVQSREAAVQSELAADRIRLARVQRQLAAEKILLVKLIKRLALSRQRLARQLVSSYETGRPDLITVVLNAHGFSDLLDQVNFLAQAERAQQTVITVTRTAKAQATAAALRLARLQHAVRQIAEAAQLRARALAGMNALLQAKQSALSHARSAQQGALQASRVEATQLRSRISHLEAEQAAAAAARAAAAAASVQQQATAAPAAPSGPTLGPSGGWAIPYSIVLCESGGQDLPPNSAGASGYYQIIPGTWSLFGGSGPAAYLAPKSEQDAVASRIWNGGAGASNWVCAGIVGIH